MKRVINIILVLCIVVCIGLLGYSGYQIYLWHNANKNIEKQVKEIEEKVDVQPEEDNSKTEIINPPKKDENKSDPYWDYIKVKLINVDFTKLKEINN